MHLKYCCVIYSLLIISSILSTDVKKLKKRERDLEILGKIAKCLAEENRKDSAGKSLDVTSLHKVYFTGLFFLYHNIVFYVYFLLFDLKIFYLFLFFQILFTVDFFFLLKLFFLDY